MSGGGGVGGNARSELRRRKGEGKERRRKWDGKEKEEENGRKGDGGDEVRMRMREREMEKGRECQEARMKRILSKDCVLKRVCYQIDLLLYHLHSIVCTLSEGLSGERESRGEVFVFVMRFCGCICSMTIEEEWKSK